MPATGLIAFEFGELCNSSTPTLIPLTDGGLLGKMDEVRFYNRAFSASEVQQLHVLESGPRVALIKAVKPTFYNLSLTTNYQLQVSSDLAHWTNQGAVFTATNINMVYAQYFDVVDFGQLFFRLLAP